MQSGSTSQPTRVVQGQGENMQYGVRATAPGLPFLKP